MQFKPKSAGRRTRNRRQLDPLDLGFVIRSLQIQIENLRTPHRSQREKRKWRLWSLQLRLGSFRRRSDWRSGHRRRGAEDSAAEEALWRWSVRLDRRKRELLTTWRQDPRRRSRGTLSAKAPPSTRLYLLFLPTGRSPPPMTAAKPPPRLPPGSRRRLLRRLPKPFRSEIRIRVRLLYRIVWFCSSFQCCAGFFDYAWSAHKVFDWLLHCENRR